MVRFFLSADVLANLTEHSRTLRLYPRPVVFFQINSFLKSRPNPSIFTCQLSRTQAVDYFAEWALTPNNVVFQRIQTGVNDPLMIGDKLKWFYNTVDPVVFIVWQEKCLIQKVLTSNGCPSSTFGNIIVVFVYNGTFVKLKNKIIIQQERVVGPVVMTVIRAVVTMNNSRAITKISKLMLPANE